MNAARRVIFCVCLAVLATVPAAGQQAPNVPQLDPCNREFIVEGIWREWRRALTKFPNVMHEKPNFLKDNTSDLLAYMKRLEAYPMELERSTDAQRKEWADRYVLPHGFWSLTATERCQLMLAVLRSDGVPEMPTEVRALLKRVVERFEKEAVAGAANADKQAAPK